MERAPIPPHERSWRHPSELVATPADPPASGTNSTHWMAAIATGAVAATLIAVLVISTPRRSTAPVAMSSTTLPAFSITTADESAAAPAPAASALATSDDGLGPVGIGQVRVERVALSTTLDGAPRSVAAPLSAPDTAVVLADDAVVHLLTSSHVYHVRWGELDRVLAPDGSLVIDGNGQPLGVFADGRFVAD